MAHTCNPRTGRLRSADHLRSGVRDQPGQHGETVFTKNTKISQVWWKIHFFSFHVLAWWVCSEYKRSWYGDILVLEMLSSVSVQLVVHSVAVKREESSTYKLLWNYYSAFVACQQPTDNIKEWAWWLGVHLYTQLTLVIPAIWEAKAGGSPEVGSLRPLMNMEKLHLY